LASEIGRVNEPLDIELDSLKRNRRVQEFK
jgi:hypothetical protein